MFNKVRKLTKTNAQRKNPKKKHTVNPLLGFDKKIK